ncbi:MAG: DUF2807 domain-containing protein [Legionella sp.]|nr:DUF2807 domain-containing protein [Legionella sp.]
MFTRLGLFIIALLLSIECVAQAPKSQLAPMPAGMAKQVRSLPSFHQIDVSGRINIKLHTGYKKPQILLSGDPRDLALVRTQIIQDKLHIILDETRPIYGEVTAEIRACALSGFNYKGMGAITGNKLYSNALELSIDNPGTTKLAGSLGLRQLNLSGGGLSEISGIYSHYMELHIEGNSKVQLSGEVNIADLDFDGDGGVNLYWIKSESLKVRGRQAAIIQLGGVVDRLDVELWGHSRFRGRYLRARRTFVKTHDRSVAEISSEEHQSTLATDASDIFYYNLPVTRADFMALNGAVLDMREWDNPEIEDFTIYNKLYP